MAYLGMSLLEKKSFTEAESLLRDCLAVRQKKQPDVWTTFNTQSLLGESTLGQKKYADAEPLLLKGYEGMKQREKSIPADTRIRLPQALDRLIELYTAMNKPNEVKKWRAERAKYPEAKAAQRGVKSDLPCGMIGMGGERCRFTIGLEPKRVTFTIFIKPGFRSLRLR